MYTLRFMFAYGETTTCLWSDNPETENKFGYIIELEQLSIPEELKNELKALCEEFQTSLNWENPAEGSVWTKDQKELFHQKTVILHKKLVKALGSAFEVVLHERFEF